MAGQAERLRRTSPAAMKADPTNPGVAGSGVANGTFENPG
jgi:hypothetical protein